MLEQAKLSANVIRKFLKQDYGLEVESLIFVPKGEVGQNYLVKCEGDKKYFLKVFGSSRLAKIVSKTLDFSTQVNYDIFYKCGIKQISHPIKNDKGKLTTKINDFHAVLLKYIDAKTINHMTMKPNDAKKICKLLANIHTKSRDLKYKDPTKEKFDIHFKETLLKLIKVLEKGSFRNKYRKELAKLITSKKSEILDCLKTLEKISKKAKQTKQKFVYCHTDPINIMKDRRGIIYLIDWDEIILGPPEHDLWFFLEDYGALALKTYRKYYGKFNVDMNVLAYYVYHRVLEDLTDYLITILLENETDVVNKEHLKETKEYCIYFIGIMERRLKKMEKSILNS